MYNLVNVLVLALRMVERHLMSVGWPSSLRPRICTYSFSFSARHSAHVLIADRRVFGVRYAKHFEKCFENDRDFGLIIFLCLIHEGKVQCLPHVQIGKMRVVLSL
jgi:hypothetical protein